MNQKFDDLFKKFGPERRRFDRSSTTSDDLEAQRQNAYFEAHWPEYRDRAIADLYKSLGQKSPVRKYRLKDGRELELRVGSYKDADSINMRDHEFYITTALAIGRDDTSFFRIASYSDSPLEPVGFYFVMNYFENDEHWTKKEYEGQRMVGESKLVYVSPNKRGQNLGSILTASSKLEVIDDPTIEILRSKVANEKVGHILISLGFRPVGKTTYGYDDYKINLREREAVRQIFQDYLNQFIQAPAPNQK